MITNKQYKEDIRSLILIIRTLYETDGRSINNKELVELQVRISSIPDEEPKPIRKLDDKNPNHWVKPQHLRNDLPDIDPHDLGNVLHIPSEDDK